MIYKILIWLVGLKSAFCGCGNDVRQHDFHRGKKHYKIENVAKLPSVLNESSALVTFHQNLISLNDSGGKNELYEFDTLGNMIQTYLIDNQKNKDWEALAIDYKNEMVYIGDIGNNCNCRKDLKVIKYNLKTQKTEGAITFRYPTQNAFPPEKKDKNFDCEAMLFLNDSLYLFSKNRGEKTVNLYAIPAKMGDYVATIKDKLRINTQVTDATINEDGTSFALITYGKTLIFDIENHQINFKKPKNCIKTSRKMTEAITFDKNNNFYFSNEQGSLYSIRKK